MKHNILIIARFMPCKQENGMFLNMQVLNMHVLDGMSGFTVSGHYMPGQNAILPRFAGFRGALTRSIAGGRPFDYAQGPHHQQRLRRPSNPG